MSMGAPRNTTRVTLTAKIGQPLTDEPFHRMVVATAQAIAERTGIPVSDIDTTGDSANFQSAFKGALADDLNTPLAMKLLHTVYDPAQLGKALDLVGIDVRRYARWIENEKRQSVDANSIGALISARLTARASKNWAESDRIRDELAAMGIALKDNKDGTTSWEVKR